MRVLGKGRAGAMPDGELRARVAGASQTLVDVGTGDGRFVRAFARAHPDDLVIGIDALAEPLEAAARKSPANALFFRASVETLPPELRGIADVVTIVLPWGRLLEGIVLGERDVVDGIAALARSSARVEITLNGEIWADALPARFEHLPLPTPDHVRDVVAPAFAAAGIDLQPAAWLTADEARAVESTWARKLRHDRAHPRFLYVVGTAR